MRYCIKIDVTSHSVVNSILWQVTWGYIVLFYPFHIGMYACSLMMEVSAVLELKQWAGQASKEHCTSERRRRRLRGHHKSQECPVDSPGAPSTGDGPVLGQSEQAAIRRALCSCWTAPRAVAAAGWLSDTSLCQLCLCHFFHVKSSSGLGCWLLPLLPAIPASAVCPPISQELSLPFSFHLSLTGVEPQPFLLIIGAWQWLSTGNITLVTLLASQAPEPFGDTSAFLLMMSFVLLCDYNEGNSPAFLRMSGTVFSRTAWKMSHPASFMQTPDSLEHIIYYHGVISQT